MEGEEHEKQEKPNPRGQQGAMKQLREEEDRDLKTIIDDLGDNAKFRIDVYRLHPTIYENMNCGGSLGHYDEAINEDTVKEDHGGGKYRLTIKKARDTGQGFQIVTHRSITIPGPPRLDTLGYKASAANAAAAAGAEPSSVVTKTFDVLTGSLRDERARVDRLEREGRGNNNGGLDPRLIEQLNAPMIAQMQALSREKQALDDRFGKMMERLNEKPDTSFQDRMLEKMTDESGRRLEALRAMHDTEMRTVRERHAADLDRTQDRFDDQIKALERSHQRELDNFKLTFTSQLESLKAGYELRIEALNREIARSERDLGKVEAETAALRAKKEKSPLEAMQEVIGYKEAMQEMGLVGGEEEEKRDLADKLLDNPLVKGIAARIAGGPEVPPQPAAPPPDQTPQRTYRDALIEAASQVPVGSPFQLQGDTRAWVKGQDGKIRPYQARRKPSGAKPGGAPTEPQEEPVNLGDPEDVKAAIAFLESAVLSQTTPKDFVASSRLFIPEGIRRLVKDKGSDWFLENVIKPSDTSPLSTQRARTWLREVGQELAKL
jgi:hypothetical protein